ncbi:phage holin family protein [Acrocarpospora phusangensis]|uniref:phage holin family protein n=1 Tax=Acrocarpospora phusangensis TaxID=1070424 RepID=UPI001951C6C7|nr:phage holin family protein [Acrocarpospora phusangensis]
MKVIVKILVVAASLWVATQVVDGITVGGSDTAKQIGTLLAVALIFGIINTLLKPIIKVVGCAFYVVTLGLFALVVNAGLLYLTSWIAEQIDLPFHVAGFWAAFWGAIIIGIVSWLLDLILGVND